MKQPKPDPQRIRLDVGEHALGSRIHRTLLAWQPRSATERVAGATLTAHPELIDAFLVTGELSIAQDGKYQWNGMPVEVNADTTHRPLDVTIRLITIGHRQ